MKKFKISIKIELFSDGISNKIGNKVKFQKEISEFSNVWKIILSDFEGNFFVEDENGDIWILTTPNKSLIVSDDDLYNEDEYLSNKDKAVIAFLNNIFDFAGDFKPDLGDVVYEEGFYSAVSKLTQQANDRVGFKLNANLDTSDGLASGTFEFNEFEEITANFISNENIEYDEKYLDEAFAEHNAHEEGFEIEAKKNVLGSENKNQVFNKSSLEILSQYDPDMHISIKAFLDSGVVETGYGSGDYEGYPFKLKYTTEWSKGYLESFMDDSLTISVLIEILTKKPLSLIDHTDFDLRLGELREGYHDIEVNWLGKEPDDIPDDEVLYRLIDIEDSNYIWDNVSWIKIHFENEKIKGFKSSVNISINKDEILNEELQNNELDLENEGEEDYQSFQIEFSSDGNLNKIGSIDNLKEEIDIFKNKWESILNFFENEFFIEDETGTIWFLASPANSVKVSVDQFNFLDAKPNKQRAINLFLNTNLINKGEFDCVSYIDYYSGVYRTTNCGDINKIEKFVDQFYLDIFNLIKIGNVNNSLKLDAVVRSAQGLTYGFFDLTDAGIITTINYPEYQLNQFSFNGYSLKNTYVFDEDPVCLSIGYNLDIEKKLKEFKKKYPHLIDRFSISDSLLLFTISSEREIQTQNWTINFLESNVNQGRNTNGEGDALSNEFYKDLFNLFIDEDGDVCFENSGDKWCGIATVGLFDCEYLFKLVESGIEWKEWN